MTAAAVHATDHPTGPLDFQDVSALRADPYLRDAAGRFAAHPADRHPAVRREANGAVLIADNPDVPNRHRVRVDRGQDGHYRVVYLDESWTR